ncbi:hypothetical protein KCP74_12560 [Salmonella enterica subsp. enterica]|nr:hypothetical protein KCP74_12560 [Salmonella enterica subsp. enterica]
MLDVDGEVSAVGGITTRSGATTQLALGALVGSRRRRVSPARWRYMNVELNSDSVQPLITGGSAAAAAIWSSATPACSTSYLRCEFRSFKLMDMDSDISGDFTSLTMNLTDQPDYRP